MIAGLSDWLRHLVTLILLAVILDVVLPGRTMHRGVRTVLGLLIMVSMLSPLRALISSHWNVSAIAASLSGPLIPSGVTVGTGTATYATDLSTALRSELMRAGGYPVLALQIATAAQPDGVLTVSRVHVVIAVPPGVRPQDATAGVQNQIALLLAITPAQVSVTAG